jgi:hypothetical protein
MDEPIDHHYLSVFYLSRWVGDDGRLCRFSRPYGPKVKGKRITPKGTGFEPGLYAMGGVPPDKAQAMEAEFMSPLDSMAAEALKLLEVGLPEEQWTSGPRSSWSRFLITQMLRTPEDIAQLKSSATQSWSKEAPELEEKYALLKREGDPPTLAEYLAKQSPAHADELALSIARKLMNHEKIGKSFNNMQWHVIDIPEDCEALLTSDRPVWMSASLAEEDAFLTIPIGPRKLFTATVSPGTQLRLRRRDKGELVAGVNQITAQHAVKFVYGADETLLPMIQTHFATRRHSSWLERLAVKHGHTVVAENSPAAQFAK